MGQVHFSAASWPKPQQPYRGRGQYWDAAAVREGIEAQLPGLLGLLNRIDHGRELQLCWGVGQISAASGR